MLPGFGFLKCFSWGVCVHVLGGKGVQEFLHRPQSQGEDTGEQSNRGWGRQNKNFLMYIRGFFVLLGMQWVRKQALVSYEDLILLLLFQRKIGDTRNCVG